MVEASGPTPELSRAELRARTITVLTQYGESSLQRLRPMVREGRGKEEMGEVRFRPGEPMHGIDLMGENLLASLVRQAELPARIIGENNTNIPLEGREPLVDITIDPLDNTSPYVRGLDIPPYSVVGAFDKNGNPIGGVIVDINGNKIYRASGNKVTVKDMETGVVKDLTRSQRKDITKPDITIASFVGEKDYSLPFFDTFRPLFDAMHKKGMLYPGGGAFVYALLASGALDAYVMMDEPRSEIDPGLPVLLAAGGKAESIDLETGKGTPYKFDASKTASDSIPLFIAYSQPEIKNAIVDAYLTGKRELEVKQKALVFYQEHLMQIDQVYPLFRPEMN